MPNENYRQRMKTAGAEEALTEIRNSNPPFDVRICVNVLLRRLNEAAPVPQAPPSMGSGFSAPSAAHQTAPSGGGGWGAPSQQQQQQRPAGYAQFGQPAGGPPQSGGWGGGPMMGQPGMAMSAAPQMGGQMGGQMMGSGMNGKGGWGGPQGPQTAPPPQWGKGGAPGGWGR
eukprot:TRINITY_DN26135_c0_g2_i1.p1 TRINITY_DN26135_c0_g2~~TRINITY_DN26135_c0_g2_i1.p1  ORF type:complete len:171 (-),score=28.50 TRINITY_DN26135_c0_g2_i1:187-699(-)